MLRGSRSCYTLVEAISLACSWFFYVIASINWILRGSDFLLDWVTGFFSFALQLIILFQQSLPSFYFLSFIPVPFNSFISYFKLYWNEHRWKSPTACLFLRCIVWRCSFYLRIPWFWASWEWPFRAGGASASSSCKGNYRLYEGQVIAEEVGTENVSVTDNWKHHAP